jgi:phosphoglycerate kinase
LDKDRSKIVELSHIVESGSMQRREGDYRTLQVADIRPGQKLKYVLDVGRESFAAAAVKETIAGAKTIFVNAVMGFTPAFGEGSQALYLQLAQNNGGMKLFGGGDTLDELKNLAPAVYLTALENSEYYFFTGGGSVLTALEQKSAYGLEPVKVLLKGK